MLNMVRAKVAGVVKFSTDRPAGWNQISVIVRAVDFAQTSPPQYANLNKDLYLPGGVSAGFCRLLRQRLSPARGLLRVLHSLWR